MNRSQTGCKVFGCIFGLLVGGVIMMGMVLYARQAAELLYAREKVERAEKLSLGLFQYVQENKTFPVLKTADDLKRALKPKYVADDAMFVIPKTKQFFQPNPYLSGKPLGKVENFASVIAVYEAEPYGSQNQRAVGLLSGAAQFVTPDAWLKMKRDSHIP